MYHLYYSYTVNGPGKVVNNLLKGLELTGAKCKSNTHRFWLNKKSKVISLQDQPIMKTKRIQDMIIGPNICTLPIDNPVVMKQEYKQMLVPAEWVRNKYERWIDKNKITVWPVGIDTDYFADTKNDVKTNDCLIYFKRREESELEAVKSLLKANNKTFEVISYGSYSEQDFLKLISRSRFGIVIDSTESQGIAIEEMMSANLPLLVWDKLVWDDRGTEFAVPATSIPYWDERCGLVFTSQEELNEKFELLLQNLDKFNPRSYVLENLSLEKQAREFLEIINK